MTVVALAGVFHMASAVCRSLLQLQLYCIIHIVLPFYNEETEAQQREMPVPEASEWKGWNLIILPAPEPRAYAPLRSSLE